MLSGVPGLLTFTMVSEDVLERTSKLPSSVHVMAGSGLPDALQVRVMLENSTTVSITLCFFTDGGSTKKDTKMYKQLFLLGQSEHLIS